MTASAGQRAISSAALQGRAGTLMMHILQGTAGSMLMPVYSATCAVSTDVASPVRLGSTTFKEPADRMQLERGTAGMPALHRLHRRVGWGGPRHSRLP